MGLVGGQHDRAPGQIGDLLADPGDDLWGGGIALGDQPGSPPAGLFTDPPVQGAPAHGWAAEVLPETGDGPGAGLGQQPAEPLAQLGAAQAGPVGQTELALAGVALDPAADGAGMVAEQLGDGRR